MRSNLYLFFVRMYLVMRLSRPKFRDPVSIPVDPADPCSVFFADSLGKITGQESVELSVGEFLMAPQTIE